MTKQDLFFRIFGEGKPLVILHGILGSSDQWIGIGKILAQFYKVIIPDLPNHGRSFHINALDYKTISEIISDFLKELSLDSYILLGHSWGGKMAMQIAVDYPENIEKLIIEDISLNTYPLSDEHKEWIEAIQKTDLASLSDFKNAEKEIGKYVHSQEQISLLLKNITKSDKHLKWKSNTEYIISDFYEVRKAIEINNHISTPTLLLRAENSSYVSMENIQEMRKKFLNLHVQTVPGSTHWIHSSNMLYFVKSIFDFISKD